MIAASMAASVRSSSPPSPMSTMSAPTPMARAAKTGPRTPACSAFVVTTWSPMPRPSARTMALMLSVVEWVRAIADGSVVSSAATAARASASRSWNSSQSSMWARPWASSRADASAMAAATSTGSGPTEPVLR